MQFQPVQQRPACPDHYLILERISLGQRRRKNIAHMSADKLPFATQPTSFHQRLVYSNVTSFDIFNEESRLWKVIEQLFQYCWRDSLQSPRTKFIYHSDCAEFHSLAVILEQDLRAENEILPQSNKKT
jgi:hypothetical protein